MRTREETLSQKERCPFLVLGTHTHPAPQVSEPPVALALPLNARHVCSRRSSTPVRGTGNKRTSQGARTTAAGAVSAPPRPSPPRPRALSNPDSAASSRLIFAEDLVQQCPRPTCSPLGFLPRRPEHAEPTALNRLLWGASLHSAPGRIPPPPQKKSWPNTAASHGSGPTPSNPGQRCGEQGWQPRRPRSMPSPGNLQGGAHRPLPHPPRPPGPSSTPSSAGVHLPFWTRREEGAGAGSRRQRVPSREESLCHIEEAVRRRRGRQGVGTWPAARRALGSVPPAICAPVPPRSPRPPRSRSLRPEPGALRLQPRRAPVAAARPPATLPLPLNSCAKYAAPHLLGSRAAPNSSRGSDERAPRPLHSPLRRLHAARNLCAPRCRRP